MKNTGHPEAFPFRALAVTSLVVVACLSAVSCEQPGAFRPYFGDIPPAVATTIVCLAGITALHFLQSRWGFKVYAGRGNGPGAPVAAVLATPFMVLITGADVWLRFPMDMNHPLPLAVVFYPSMGYVAQMALHVVPLALLLAMSQALGRVRATSLASARTLLISFALVSALEAGFQLRASLADNSSSLLGALVALHLFAFGFIELSVFRRYDLVSMVVFRLSYYAWWHILWAYLRLQWLF